MKPRIPILSIILLFIPACAPAPVVPPPGMAILSRDAALYGGPGDLAYEKIAEFPAGTVVTPLGIYVDFVKVEVEVEERTAGGYIWKDALAYLPEGLTALDRFEVPWEPLFDPICSPGVYDAAAGTTTFRSISAEQGYNTRSAFVDVDRPFRIRIDSMSVENAVWGANTWTAEWNDIKVVGITDLGIRPSVDGEYVLSFLKERLATGYIFAEIDTGLNVSGPIQILFDLAGDDGRIGRTVSVLTADGATQKTIDMTSMARDGLTQGYELPDGLFPDDYTLFFGTDTMANTSLAVKGLAVENQPAGKWSGRPGRDPEGLFHPAEDGQKTIGSEFRFDRTIDGRYCRAMRSDFNLAVLSDFTYEDFWIGPGKYNWGSVDRTVEFALRQEWRIRASHLLWGDINYIPPWLKEGRFLSDLPPDPPRTEKEIYTDLMVNHIHDVIGRYKGKVHEWSVANEAAEMILCTEENPTVYDFWYTKIGEDYIRLAFETARAAAEPGDILIFNSAYNHPFAPLANCEQKTLPKMLDIVRGLNAKYLTTQNTEDRLVDAVGMEMHLFNEYTPKKDCLISIMRQFAELGVRVYITEMDRNLTFKLDNFPDERDRWEYEACVYSNVMDACMESGVCDSFATWGVSDALSYLTDPAQKNLPESDPLLFDKYFVPKPAYFAVRDSLLGAHNSLTCHAGEPAPEMCPSGAELGLSD